MTAFLRRNLLWVALGAAALIVLASSGGLWDFLARRREYGGLSAKLAEARGRLANKQTLLARADEEDGFMEDEARRSLSLVRADELEFRFPPAGDSPEKTPRQAPAGPR